MITDVPLTFSGYSQASLDRIDDTYSGYVRPGDAIFIGSGSFDNPLDMGFVNEAIAATRVKYPMVEIYLLTAGKTKLQQMVDELLYPVEGIGHAYEPNTPGFNIDAAYTQQFLRDCTAIVRPTGFKSIVMPSGRPVFGKIDGVFWDYGRMSLEVDLMYAQLQAWSTQNLWREAYKIVKGQFNAVDSDCELVPQITVDKLHADGGMINGIDPLSAARYARFATERGVDGICDFYATSSERAAVNLEFLKLVRPNG